MKPVSKQHTTRSAETKIWLISGITGVAFLTFLLYTEVFSFEILYWDDNVYLFDNPYLKDFSLKGIKAIFSTFYASNYHPLTTLSWMIEYAISGYNPTLYHFTNLFLHLANVILVLVVTRRLTGNTVAAIVAALIFGIHPMHAESVAWISERKDLLFFFFGFLSLNAYLIYTDHKSRTQYFTALLFFLLSLLSKSAAVVIPGLIILVDLYRNRKFNSKVWLEKIPFLVLSVIFIYLTLKSQVITTEASFAAHFPYWQRPLIAGYALLYYFGSYFLPVKLSPLHPYPSLPGSTITVYLTASLVLVLIIALFFFFFYRYSQFRKSLWFGLGFFVIALLPVLQFIPVGQAIVADRYTYLPYAGLAILTGIIVTWQRESRVGRRSNLSTITWVVLGGFCLYFFIQTKLYLPTWKSSISLFTYMTEQNPGHAWSWYNLGRTRMEKGEYLEAEKDLTKALEIEPGNNTIRYLRSQAYINTGNLQGVIRDLDLIIRTDTTIAGAYINRGNARGMLKDYSGSVRDFTQALRLLPNDTSLLINRGLSYWYAGDLPNACRDWKSAEILGSRKGSSMREQYCR